MDKFDRIYCLHQILETHRYPVSLSTLCERMECSPATVKRLIREMRDYLNAPIINRRNHGYFYDRQLAFELPGIWFTAVELESLLIMQKALTEIGSGLLGRELEPMRRRVESILSRLSPRAVTGVNRIRVLAMGRRGRKLAHFPLVAAAVLERFRLRFTYAGRASDEETRREVSPQRLVYYRDNWYLDAFCHLRDGLRTFSLDRMSAVMRAGDAVEMDDARLDEHLVAAYGIFSGPADKIAVLRFTPARARWIADEIWHPDQSLRHLPDGSLEIIIPYGNPTELILDICRYGPDVEVIDPPDLRSAVAGRLRAAAARYF
jgi:predicted DNA-binding transcriptional regulator YafY